ncbi:hypothetical protein D3C80_559020 [compost metagenome]
MIEHDGRGMPVDGDILVKVRHRDGWVSPCPLRALQWKATVDRWVAVGRPDDIVAYERV